MTSVDCATAGAQNRVGDAQSVGHFHGNSQQRADQLVRAIVLHDFGQKGGGVQGLAARLQKVLSKSGVSGTDAPDDLLKKVEASLGKAAQALADRGYDAKTIDATIDKFRAQLADALDKLAQNADQGDNKSGDSPGAGSSTVPTPTLPTSSVPKSTGLRVDQFVAREVRRQQGAIDIQTADGDVVSIRFRTKDVVTDSYRQASGANGTTVSARESVVSRGRLEIAVDGSLDDGELAAIGDLLDKVNALASKFFSGDVQAAFAAASDLGVDSDEIASYQLDLTYSRKVAIAASTRISLPVSGAPVSLPTQPAPAQQTQSASTQSAAQSQPASSATATPASQQASVSPPGSPQTSELPSSGSPSSISQPGAPAASASSSSSVDGGSPDGTAPQPSEPAMPSATARKTIADYIGDVLSKLGSVDGAGRLTFSLRFKVSVLTSALLTLQANSSQAKDPAVKSTQLLTDSLDKAVA